MTNQTALNSASSNDTVQINLDCYEKLEQAELLARFLLNTDHTNKNEFIIAVSCIADLLCSVMKKEK